MTENQIILTNMVLPKFLLLFPVLLLSGCFTDSATRLAYDIEAGAARVGKDSGDKFLIEHRTPSKAGECEGRYKVQMDKVGAIIVWCMDDTGADVVSSHSTSYHARFVDTPRTYILDKQAGEELLIELERRNGRVVIAEVK